MKFDLFLQKITQPLAIKFGPRVYEQIVKSNVIKVIFAGNPIPTNVSVTMDQICENKNATCPKINLQEGDNNIVNVAILNRMPENDQKDKEDILLSFPRADVEITVMNPEKLQNQNSTILVSVSNGIGLPLELNIDSSIQIVYQINKGK